MTNHLLLRARELIDAGFSCIPVDHKRPVTEWKVYQDKLPDDMDLAHWGLCKNLRYDGLAVICGQVSGNLECLDFDDPVAWEQFKRFAPKALLDACYYQLTPSGGSHLVYRTPGCVIDGNKKLARDQSGQVRIETRGEGGYFLVPPSPGYETFQIFERVLPTLSTQERDTLHRYARIFDEFIDGARTHTNGESGLHEGQPGWDFNNKGDIRPTLVKYGWQMVCTRADGVELWERPGKSEQSVSATYGIGGSNLFYVFSSNAHPFKSDQAYTPFAVYALLECGGDFTRAAGELASQGYGGRESPENIEWEEPAPLAQVDRPDFPLFTYPDWLQDFLIEVSRSLEVPMDMPAMLALGCIAACVAKKVSINPKSDWKEPTNLYIAVPMPPASTKSGTLEAIKKPISDYEKSANERTKIGRQIIQTRKQITESLIDRTVKELTNSTTEEERVLLEEKLAQQYEELNQLSGQGGELCLTVKDITPEMLVKKLAENGGKMAVIDDEAGLFGMMAGRYSSGSTNIDVYLTGHSGGDLRVSRISREDDVVENPALTLVLSVQPGAMEGLTLSSEFRDRGLLGRFLIVYPDDNIGKRECANRSIDPAKRLIYHARLTELLDYKGKEINLVYSPDAEEFFWNEVRKIERRLGQGGDLFDLRDWGGKLRGQIARISAILHVLDVGLHSDNLDNVVPLATLKRAWGLAEYLITHAKFAFEEMGYDDNVRKARRIINWLERTQKTEFKRRDIYTNMKTLFTKPHAVDEPLRLLVDRGYIHPKTKEVSKGKVVEQYLVNPHVLKEKVK